MEIIKSFIPETRHNRPGVKITPTSITVHNTGNTSSGADARMHASYIKTTNQSVSWHYTVDDEEIIQHIPTDEMAWHAGSKVGNSTSIGIEICMHTGIDMPKAEEKAQKFIAYLMHELSITDINKHQDWTGKYCPQVLLKEGRWESFKEGCYRMLDQLQNENNEHWAKQYYDALIEKGIIINEQRFDDYLTRGELFAMMCRILEKIGY